MVDKGKEIVLKAQEKFIKVPNCSLDFEREGAFALQMFRSNPALLNTDQQSVIDAIVNVAMTGLTLNPALAFAYLVPRKGKCILDISYRGMIKILTDFGTVRNVIAELVYEKDKFFERRGTDPMIEHIPATFKDRGKIIGSYAVGFFHDGKYQFETMKTSEIEAIKKRSPAVKAGKGSPWDTDEGEMFRKTPIRRLFKYLPKTKLPENIVRTIELDTQNNAIDFKKEVEIELSIAEVTEITGKLKPIKNKKELFELNTKYPKFQKISLYQKLFKDKLAEIEKDKAFDQAQKEEFVKQTIDGAAKEEMKAVLKENPEIMTNEALKNQYNAKLKSFENGNK